MSSNKKHNNNKNNINTKPKESLEENEIKNNKEIKEDLKEENNRNNKDEKEKNAEDNKKEEEKKEEVINLDSNNDVEELSQSIQNLLLDKDFAAPVVLKKENKLITNYHYATFKNSYGENTCYINVILHLLYSIDELEEFLSSLYKIEESTKGNNNDKNNNDENNIDIINENNEFLVSLGKILNNYDEIITESNEENNKKKKESKDKQVTVINTIKMRKILEKLSNNKFPLNTIADPVELFTFILDILNENLNGDTHKTFYLELIDEYICNKKGCTHIQNNYDKDNFMYHIYIDDILNFIQKGNLKVKDYKNKLFEISYKSFLSGDAKKCEKCKGEMTHNLICKNCPDFILINCVWRESNPIVDDVMSVFFLMNLKDELNNLFMFQNNSNKKIYYHLFGFILYSFTLSHYIICKYNEDKQVFVLLDDEIVKEYNNLKELIEGITVEILKTNGKAFFYPVMLIYTNENLYNHRICKINSLKEIDYQEIINNCNQAIYEYQSKNEIKEEMKSDNYQKLIKEQQEIEEEIKKRAKKTEAKNKKEDNKLEEVNKTDKNKIIDLDKEDKKNKENKNEPIVISDDEKDNKIKKDNTEQKNEIRKRNKSKEIILEDENKKSRSKSKKKENQENQKKEKEIEMIENKKEDNKSNDIQKLDSNANKKKQTKVKKKKVKTDINEIIWNQQPNKEKINEKKEGNENKINLNKINTKKETLQKRSSIEKKEIENDPKYLGKKTNYSNNQNEGYHNNYKRKSDVKENKYNTKGQNNYNGKYHFRNKNN